jgi:putative salt-induced outer membrane protein
MKFLFFDESNWRQRMNNATSLLLLTTLASSGNTFSADAAPDGRWRGNGGAAASLSSGNTRSDNMNLTVDTASETTHDKLSLTGQILREHTEVNGVKSRATNQWRLGTRYDYNLSAATFEFGGLDLSSDELQSLTMRHVISAGLGIHLTKTPDSQLDVFGGISHRADRYSNIGVTIANKLETKFSTAEAMFGEESLHKLTENTTLKQRLSVNRNLGSEGYRAAFDASLLVAINTTISLTVSVQDRFNSIAETPVQKNDFTLFTGVNVKFGS